jgi:hypothetical protein
MNFIALCWPILPSSSCHGAQPKSSLRDILVIFIWDASEKGRRHFLKSVLLGSQALCFNESENLLPSNSVTGSLSSYKSLNWTRLEMVVPWWSNVELELLLLPYPSGSSSLQNITENQWAQDPCNPQCLVNTNSANAGLTIVSWAGACKALVQCVRERRNSSKDLLELRQLVWSTLELRQLMRLFAWGLRCNPAMVRCSSCKRATTCSTCTTNRTFLVRRRQKLQINMSQLKKLQFISIACREPYSLPWSF